MIYRLDGLRLRHVESDELVATYHHPYMAAKALEIAEALGPFFHDWLERYERRMHRLFRVVPCAHCYALVGSPCRRPSEGTTWREQPHEPRRAAMDEWLLALEVTP